MDTRPGVTWINVPRLPARTCLVWQVSRLHRTPRGSWILTAFYEGRIATVEVPERLETETEAAWVDRLEQLLAESAYDPSDGVSPVLLRVISSELADLITISTTT